MKNTTSNFKHILFLFVVITMLVPKHVAYSSEIPNAGINKLEQKLQKDIKTDKGTYIVWIWVEEPSYDEAYKNVDKQMGALEDFSGTEEEWNRGYEWLLNYALIGLYDNYNKHIINELNLTMDEIIPGYYLKPVIGAKLSKERICELLQSDFVKKICYYNAQDVIEPDKYNIYNYTAEHALKILQVCVKLKPGYVTWEYDVNFDEYITIHDALWALQASVKLYTISWPIGRIVPE